MLKKAIELLEHLLANCDKSNRKDEVREFLSKTKWLAQVWRDYPEKKLHLVSLGNDVVLGVEEGKEEVHILEVYSGSFSYVCTIEKSGVLVMPNSGDACECLSRGLTPGARPSEAKKNETACELCGTDPVGGRYHPKSGTKHLCRRCYDRHISDEIAGTPMPTNMGEFNARQTSLWLKVVEHSELTGEGMSSDVTDLGLVAWIDDAFRNLPSDKAT